MIIAILALLLAISEVLSFIPSVKANGIFQMFVNFITTLKDNIKPQ